MRRSSSRCRTPRTRPMWSASGRWRPRSAPGCGRSSPTFGSSSPTIMPSSSSIRRRRPSLSMWAARRPGNSPGASSTGRIPSEIGFELVRSLYRQNFDPAFSQHRPDRLCDRHPAHPSGPHRSGAAHLRQCLSAAAADHGALLCVRAGHRPHRHGDGIEDRHPVERRHVAFPRHRPLRQSGARLGPARSGKARCRKPQVADRL